jgi:hypothetical protein
MSDFEDDELIVVALVLAQANLGKKRLREAQ